jgi:hypothetical protein
MSSRRSKSGQRHKVEQPGSAYQSHGGAHGAYLRSVDGAPRTEKGDVIQL